MPNGPIRYFNHEKYTGGGATLCRRVVDRGRIPASGCTWCGKLNAWGKLFEFGVRGDGTRESHIIWNPGLFCSHQCYHNYHGH